MIIPDKIADIVKYLMVFDAGVGRSNFSESLLNSKGGPKNETI